MGIKVDNLFVDSDGYYFCLLSDDARTMIGDADEWFAAVIFTGTDGRMRTTERAVWEVKYKPVADYTGDDESVLALIRRCNPGDRDLDFISIFESWHESEMGVTGHMLELAVAAVIQKYEWPGHLVDAPSRYGEEGNPDHVELTIMTADLQRIAQQYRIERVPIPHGFTFHMRK